jgi:hypothetical protein
MSAGKGRIRRSKKPQAGSAILVVLFLGVILSVMAGSYLVLVNQQNTSTTRSMVWNGCIAIAEAGVEEGISQIHYTGVTNLSANGWTLSGGVYAKQRFLSNNYYFVTITPNDPPVITSAGYVPLPWGSMVTYVKRTVRVTTQRDGAFVKAMLAKGQIDFNGNNIRTDSFDSSSPTYSKNGQYDRTRAKDNGDVATNSGLTNSLNVGNANIYGHVATGPHGSVYIGTQGAVGDSNWQTGNTGIEPGWFSDDMNVSFPDVSIPYTSGFNPDTNAKVNGKTYAYVLNNGNYVMTDLTLQNSDVLFVNGTANLYVTGSINLTGNAQIEIGAKGSLVLYMGGDTATFGGNEIVNGAGNALNFVYLGLPTNTTLRFVGNADFTGSIYAPSADFQLGGGGSSPYDFVGASVSNTVQMNGHFNFHYDENLGKSQWGRGYVITSWDEL